MENIRIDAENLIVGNGELIKNGSVVYEGEKISYAGETEHAPTIDDIVQTNTVMPGMWECHGHYTGLTKIDYSMYFENPFQTAMRCVGDAKVTLEAGFTSVREVGGYGVILRKAIEEGSVVGPRIYGAGSMLSITGGHGDAHSMPYHIMDYMMATKEAPFSEIVDGVDEVLKGVRKQLRMGAEVIKFHSSGGVLSEIDNPINQQFSLAEARAIVEEATRAKLAVAAHCHGSDGIWNALNAGVTSIEHGTYLTDELADLMVEKNAILVPTRVIIEDAMQVKHLLPDYARIKMEQTADRNLESLKLAIRKGVKVACGTDIAFTHYAPFNKWGTNAKELEHYVNAGMTPMQAIVTATGTGPKTLGPHAPMSGMLKEGYDSDIILLKANPLDNIKLLQDKENFQSIIKRGKSI